MTKTTDSRQLRLMVDGILQAYDIDNLQLSIDLCSAFKEFFASEIPVNTREEVIGRIRLALGKNFEQQTLDEQIEIQFKRFPLNWIAFREDDKDMFRKFLKSNSSISGLSIFIDWWLNDEWRLAHPPANLGVIMQKWPQAFVNRKPTETPEDRQFRNIGI